MDEKHLNKELIQSSCLNERELTGLVKGVLSQKEREKVLRHIHSCDFCADAVEGIREMESSDTLTAVLQHVRHHNKKQLLRRRRPQWMMNKNQFWIIMTTIVVLGLLLVAYFVLYILMK